MNEPIKRDYFDGLEPEERISLLKALLCDGLDYLAERAYQATQPPVNLDVGRFLVIQVRPDGHNQKAAGFQSRTLALNFAHELNKNLVIALSDEQSTLYKMHNGVLPWWYDITDVTYDEAEEEDEEGPVSPAQQAEVDKAATEATEALNRIVSSKRLDQEDIEAVRRMTKPEEAPKPSLSPRQRYEQRQTPPVALPRKKKEEE